MSNGIRSPGLTKPRIRSLASCMAVGVVALLGPQPSAHALSVGPGSEVCEELSMEVDPYGGVTVINTSREDIRVDITLRAGGCDSVCQADYSDIWLEAEQATTFPPPPCFYLDVICTDYWHAGAALVQVDGFRCTLFDWDGVLDG